jgi:hypothetical protein
MTARVMALNLLLAVVVQGAVGPFGLDLFMPVPERNPLHAQTVALGRRLFFAWDGEALTDEGAGHGEFKTPTLREVGRTAPYMHDGSIATLEEVVDFYDRGGRRNPDLDGDIRRLLLSAQERSTLVYRSRQPWACVWVRRWACGGQTWTSLRAR